MKTTITSRQRRRLEAGIKSQIRHHQRCLKLIPAVDLEAFTTGMEAFGSEAALALWLCRPARALGGKIPVRMIRTAKGRKAVVHVLGAIAHNVYL